MTNTKHTQGPWIADDYDHSAFASEAHKDDYFMRIEWSVDTTKISENEIKANVRLIEAAPELLEALEKLSAYYQDQPINPDDYADSQSFADAIEKRNDLLDLADDAIAKARGQSCKE